MIVVVDFGSQYTHLLASRLGGHRVDPGDPLPPDVSGVVLSGGPGSVFDPDAPRCSTPSGVPVLGVCYGMQLLVQQGGGTVERGQTQEFGRSELTISAHGHPLLQGMPQVSTVWMSHADRVTQLPPGFTMLASTPDCPYAVVADAERRVYGVQFHPEVVHSSHGSQLLRNFLQLCGTSASPKAFSFDRVRQTAGNKKVFMLVSGGVDSAVAFVVLNRVLGKGRVRGLHINNGLMRHQESWLVVNFLQRRCGLDNLELLDASNIFVERLADVLDPQEKRRIIGDTFLDIVTPYLQPDCLLGQGTIYPDTIESGHSGAATIKTHHNRVDAIKQMIAEGRVVEPLVDLYKHEVRQLARELGLPQELIERHPFPGPGLGIRIICNDGLKPIHSVGVQGDCRTYAGYCIIQHTGASWDEYDAMSTQITNGDRRVNRVLLQLTPGQAVRVRQDVNPFTLDILRHIDHVCTCFLKDAGIYKEIWQMPVVLLPLRVNMWPVVVLRPVVSVDAMTAEWYRMDFRLLSQLVRLLTDGGSYVGGVLYDITHKPPGTIEWE